MIRQRFSGFAYRFFRMINGFEAARFQHDTLVSLLQYRQGPSTHVDKANAFHAGIGPPHRGDAANRLQGADLALHAGVPVQEREGEDGSGGQRRSHLSGSIHSNSMS